MTTPAEAPNVSLEDRVAQLQAQVDAYENPKPGKVASATKATGKGVKKFLASLAAAFTTPDAVKAEKSLAVIALTRLAILAPSLAVVISIIVHSLGGPGVNP